VGLFYNAPEPTRGGNPGSNGISKAWSVSWSDGIRDSLNQAVGLSDLIPQYVSGFLASLFRF